MKLICCSILYPVDLEVWRKLAQRARIKRFASKFAHDFYCDWQRVSAFSHSVTLTRVLLSQIISKYSDTKGSVLVVMECKRACKCDLCIGVFTSYFKVNRVYKLYYVVIGAEMEYGAWSDFSEWRYLLKWCVSYSSLKKFWFKISVNLVEPCWHPVCEEFICIAIAKTLLCKLNYDYHNQSHFH